MHKVFESVFPIFDYSNNCKLEYTSFKLDKPEFNEEECRISSKTYSVPIKVNFKLYTNIDEKNSDKIEIFENEEVFLGELPIMTKYGTFIVNGTERVVVSQLHRSPGVFLIMTEEELTRLASSCFQQESYHIEDRGLILNLIRKILFLLELIAAGK